MVLILFTMAFVIGPALFFVLDRFTRKHWPLAFAASVFVMLSFLLRSEANLTLQFDVTRTFLSVASIWIAWILIVTLVAGALRDTFPSAQARRLIRAGGAMGTTVPWFGFAAAQMMAR